MQEAGRVLLGIVANNIIFFAQVQLLLWGEALGNIVQNAGLGGKLRVLTPTAGKRDGLAFTAGNVGDAFLAEHGVGLFAQPAQFGLGIIKAAADDLGIYRIRQILPSAALAEGSTDFGGAHGKGRMRKNHDIGPICGAEVLFCVLQDLVVIQVAGQHGQAAAGEQVLKMVPFLKA